MYEWLDKEFNRLTEEIEEVRKQKATNQQKRNAFNIPFPIFFHSNFDS